MLCVAKKTWLYVKGGGNGLSCLFVVDDTSFTKQEKLLLKFDSILAALGVCDQVSLKNQNR